MEQEKLNKMLAEVIAQARALKIPVSENILPDVSVNSRAKSRFGCCKRLPEGGFLIELSLHTVSAKEKEIKQVLAHEILHSCYGCLNHGKRWKSYAEKMNSTFGYAIKRTDSRERMGIEEQQEPAPRYELICKSCGAKITRSRKSRLITETWRYRCRCGGKLERIK